ncbi:MAG: shikimate kinase [Patescibacteria group bacterium]
MKHLILIGFKHTGKSVIGRRLAERMSLPFQELDSIVEEIDERAAGARRTPREIMRAEGEPRFRELETEALKLALSAAEPSVIAAGGGTPMHPVNHELIGGQTVVLITAPKGIVYERIMVHGRPAFFPEGEDTYQTFRKILAEREPVFNALADIIVMNDRTVEDAVEAALSVIKKGSSVVPV